MRKEEGCKEASEEEIEVHPKCTFCMRLIHDERFSADVLGGDEERGDDATMLIITCWPCRHGVTCTYGGAV